MKFTDGNKTIFIKKLTTLFTGRVSSREFNEVFLFLAQWNNAYRTVPYGVFEEKEDVEFMEVYPSGQLCKIVVEESTANIPKSFNKSRKLVRSVEDIVEKHGLNLAYTLGTNNFFKDALTCFFVEYDEAKLPFPYDVEDIDRFNAVLGELRSYLACILYLDMLNEVGYVADILDLFVNGNEDTLIEDLIEYGLTHE